MFRSVVRGIGKKEARRAGAHARLAEDGGRRGAAVRPAGAAQDPSRRRAHDSTGPRHGRPRPRHLPVNVDSEPPRRLTSTAVFLTLTRIGSIGFAPCTRFRTLLRKIRNKMSILKQLNDIGAIVEELETTHS